eukprot:6945826-Pyramimonas_sp.AAC.1
MRPASAAPPPRRSAATSGFTCRSTVAAQSRYSHGEKGKGLWGVECALAVIGTGGPVKRSNGTASVPMQCQ